MRSFKNGVFHVHTHHSFDCMTSPRKIVDAAVAKGIHYLVISDHDSAGGSIEAHDYAKEKKLPIEIPIAAEYYTDIGDIVVVGIPRDFQKIKDHKELCTQVKAGGGYTVLPHPYDDHQLDKLDFSYIDFIEVFNSKTTPQHNHLSAQLAEKTGKPTVYGADAHFIEDLFNCPFIFENVPFQGVEPLTLQYTPQRHKILSQFVKGWKKRDARLCCRSLLRLVGLKSFRREKK